MPGREGHRAQRSNWLRAAVLGANDGLISTSSLVVGVAFANASQPAILLAASAGMVAGALSMAAGEYVSVSSQSDAEAADLDKERRGLEASPDAERDELIGIYRARGLDLELASRVVDQLTAQDALDAHARDELGLHRRTRARPIQAALSSSAAFAVGALPPVALAGLLSADTMSYVVMGSSLVFLAILGATAARLGGAPPVAGALRVSFWGALAMAVTALVGRLVGTFG